MSTLTSALDIYDKYIVPLEKITDGYIQLQNRLNAVNDGLQTQAKLQDKVFAAANRSRGSYSAMVGTFAKLQATAGKVFGSSSNTLAFSELMQKSFKLGGTDAATQSSGMDAVIQAMGSGKIDGGAFDSITADAPMMLQAMETFTGKSKAELRSMAEEGTLTADILKNSMFAASGDINKKFSEMPMTFAEIWDRIKNVALQAFGGVLDGINSIINSGGFQTFLDAAILGIYTVGSVLEWIVNKFEYLVPILEVIGGVLLVLIITDLGAAAVAAWGLISAFIMANWTVICIVAAIVAVITVLGALGVTVQDVFNFIGGAIGVLIAWFINLGAIAKNAFILVLKSIDDMVTGCVNGAIDAINLIIEALNAIPGVEIDLVDHIDKSFGGLKYEKMIDYSDAYNKGSKISTDLYNGLGNKISSFTNGFGLGAPGAMPGISSDGLGTSNNPVTVQGVGSNGTLGVDMAEEDIQYLRDIAERDYINKFSTSTLAPNIQVSFGDIHKEADADKVASRIQWILQEQIATASEGVYE